METSNENASEKMLTKKRMSESETTWKNFETTARVTRKSCENCGKNCEKNYGKNCGKRSR